MFNIIFCFYPSHSYNFYSFILFIVLHEACLLNFSFLGLLKLLLLDFKTMLFLLHISSNCIPKNRFLGCLEMTYFVEAIIGFCGGYTNAYKLSLQTYVRSSLDVTLTVMVICQKSDNLLEFSRSRRDGEIPSGTHVIVH